MDLFPPSILSPAPTGTKIRWSVIAVAVGVFGIALCEALLLADVQGWLRNTAVASTGEVVRENMTPLAWCFYLILLAGFLALFDGHSFVRRFRNRLAVCWLWSVTCWCYFDWMNFYFMRDPKTGLRAWEYINLPADFSDRVLGYLLAFGAVCPGMFLTAELFTRAGFHRLNTNRSKPIPLPRPLLWFIALLGVLLCAIPITVGGSGSNLALWLGTFCLLDPINRAFHRPSILADWQRGYWGRTLALGAAGLFCGFLWEFWNYWAITKWQYHLPFLGAWEHIKYFEMPVPGLAGFIAFGIQCWVMWQTTLILLGPAVEGEGQSPADQNLAKFGCI